MMNYFQFLLKRLKEPSTFAAIAAGLTASQAVADAPTKALVIGASIAGVLVPETK